MVESFFYIVDLYGISGALIALILAAALFFRAAHIRRRQSFFDVRLKQLSDGIASAKKEKTSLDLLTLKPVKDRKVRWSEFLTIKRLILLGFAMICVLLWGRYGQPLLFVMTFSCLSGGILYFLQLQSSSHRKMLTEQFPEALDLMVRGGRVGVTPEESFRQAAEKLPLPLRDVFKQLSVQIDIGLPFDHALMDMAAKLDLKEFRFLAITLSVQRRTGGRYVDVLENLSQILRDYQEQGRKTEAMTSEARLAAKIVALLVALSCGLLFFQNRDQFDFFIYDPTGNQLITYSIASIATGFFVIYQLLEAFRR